MMDRRIFLRLVAGAVAGTALGPQVLDLVESLPEPELLAWQDEMVQLCHDIFVGRIVENAGFHTPFMKLYDECPTAPELRERLAGQGLIFYTDLRYVK